MPLTRQPPRLHRACLLALCVSATATAWANEATTKSPNVLFIICDDLSDSVEGLGGHPQASTPHISRLMRQGVRFTNAHNNFPLCGPSRASLWSGLYPRTTGNYAFRDWRKNPVLASSRTVLHHFRSSGYGVHGTGKIFHNGQEPLELYDSYEVPADFGPFPSDGVQRREHPTQAFLLDGYRGMPFHWAQTFGPLSDVPRYPPDKAAGTPGFDGWQLWKKPFRYVSSSDRDLMPDELSARRAAEFLAADHEKPFFLAVGFARPHTPLYAPKKYFERFPLETIQLPPYLENDTDDCAAALIGPATQLSVAQRGYGFARYRMIIDGGGEALWKRWIQAYLACISFVDDQVGAVLDALEKSAHRQNTIIVFTSDHGYHMGEKNSIYKDSLWDEGTRVPLAIVVPGNSRAGSDCAQPVSLIDIYPTLIDLCGLPEQPNASGNGLALDGFSMAPLLADPAGKWQGPSVALTTTATRRDAEGKPVLELHDSVRGRDWRYTLCASGEEELYDHRTDPHEWHNLAKKPQYADEKKRLRAELEALTDRGSGK